MSIPQPSRVSPLFVVLARFGVTLVIVIFVLPPSILSLNGRSQSCPALSQVFMLIGCDACLQYIEAEAENAEVINRRTTFSN
ncbi:hypothetical protein SAMN05216598_4393 [Pseudomonas asplenii]|uniref:Uncharacterized protein n=1 Tax=Pseudomonas asplenii TaxID=53407 RepID=A0A1H1YEV2_9PSED|nr:hypothetical protein SAMN05216598_4393 [Pseudomonas asplenii]